MTYAYEVIKAIGAAGRSMLVIAVFCLMVVYVFALTLKQITLIAPGTKGVGAIEGGHPRPSNHVKLCKTM